MTTQIVSTIVIVHHDGKFLLVRRNLQDDIFPGKWQNAGGKLEDNETIEAAAIRELHEETALDIGAAHLQFVMSYSWRKAADEPTRLGIILLADLPNSAQLNTISLDSELCEYGWFTLADALKLDTIGPDSPTGTMGQLNKASELLR